MKLPPCDILAKPVDWYSAFVFSIFASALMNFILLTYLKQYITAFEDIQNHKFVFYNGIKQIMWILGLFIYMPLHSLVLYIGYEHYHIPVYILAIITGFVWMFWDIMPLMMMHDAQLHSFWLVFDIFAAGLFWVVVSFLLFNSFTHNMMFTNISFILFIISNLMVFYVFYVFNRDDESGRSVFVKIGDAVLSLFGISGFRMQRVENPIVLSFLQNEKVLI